MMFSTILFQIALIYVCLLSTLDSPTSYIPSLLWLEGEHVGGTFHVRTRQLCASVGKSGGPEQSSNQMSKKIGTMYTKLYPWAQTSSSK